MAKNTLLESISLLWRSQLASSSSPLGKRGERWVMLKRIPPSLPPFLSLTWIFSLFQAEEHGATGIGLVLVLMNLCCDGFTNATQDKINEMYKLPYLQMMLCMNGPSCLLLLAFLFNPVNGSGPDAITFVRENPSLIWDILGFSAMGAMGQNFIFFTIKEFGSLTCQTMTLTRKAVQILLSVLLFGHTISSIQWVGCGIVFFGLAGNMYSKEINRRNKKAAEVKEAKAE